MKNTHFLTLILLAVLAFVMTSCASVSTMQTAGTVPEGQVRWAISSTGTGGNGDSKPVADPNFEAAVRYGVTDSMDVGLKINFLGAQLGAKYQFLRGEFDLSVGLEAGYQWVRTSGTDDPSSHVLEFQLPILMEYHFNPYVGLAFGPKFLGIYVVDSDNREDVWRDSGMYVGLMIGLPLRLTQGIWFQPEFNIYTNAYSDMKHNSSNKELVAESGDTKKDDPRKYFSTMIWQIGVSVFFGGL